MKDDRAEYQRFISTRTVAPPAVVYKYVPIDTAAHVLESGRLRFKSPRRYNDPFDCQWNHMWSIETAEALELRATLFERAVTKPGSVPPNASPRHQRVFAYERQRMGSPGSATYEAKLKEMRKGLREGHDLDLGMVGKLLDMTLRMRVCCFCESELSTLMWSHYACEHRGVVLGFDSRVLEDKYERPLEKVAYEPTLPVLLDPEEWARHMAYGLPAPQIEGHGRQLALTKAKVWEYEQEWRFVWIAKRGTLGDKEDIRFPKSALREVIFGCKAAAEDIATVSALLPSYEKAYRFETVKGFGQFVLVKMPLE